MREVGTISYPIIYMLALLAFGPKMDPKFSQSLQSLLKIMQRDPKILLESSKVLKIIPRSKQAREESPWKGKNALSGG